jgi:DNA-binding CsgD family transcriptional regulator
MAFDSTPSPHSIYTKLPAAYTPTARAKRAPRKPNYRSGSTPATIRKQERIAELLELAGEGLTVAEVGKALGMSRQLALYHVKKMAASYGCAMILEPCNSNGGLQFKVWNEMALAAHYSRFLIQTTERKVAARHAA